MAHSAYTTSGRAAIFQALIQLNLPAGSEVLLPTYHCPTMVAPVLLAGHRPSYFGICANGLPNLQGITPEQIQAARAMLVPHYFGLPQSLAHVRHWCDQHHIALIEDCAHSLFGVAGERNVGSWGDFATASLSKFLPVPEAGLLASASRPLQPMAMTTQGAVAQVKGVIDILELAAHHQRLAGLNSLGSAMLRIKKLLRPVGPKQTTSAHGKSDCQDFMAACDMGRIKARPLRVSTWLSQILPRQQIITRRRENFELYANLLGELKGAQPLMTHIGALANSCAAPYVYPLWVDDAERVYHGLRLGGYPVFRWDRIWPGTPTLTGDVGPLWSHHVLQLLCHQDLCAEDISKTAAEVQRLLAL
ncbi:DegT/DnrJ/EryC1/StrS family aminotransferase [Paucibacter sp. B2R-40]|uniref:DegT/DnrJ/EryC1/StrS family aminotransferase n=1 Tax=Paucibacter sp. B2R-40 TaxID=2893554 RepID=UPI0021E3889A|nr:DegT/DnrJ/EryC1/StrS family aminotransferase [Paucibacter sp. B2R-40]MCV2355504.1 DegT/DnrJ/EryC1/StrS family aminotransferase [Paucibacter sp. B2R-40]